MTENELCPCCSHESYATCCYPVHIGLKNPESALTLMRSRYAAYAKNLPQYIISTTHKRNPDYFENKADWILSIAEFSHSTEFKGLEIISHDQKGDRARVTFIAYLEQNGVDGSFKEKSEFIREGGKWQYLRGVQHASS